MIGSILMCLAASIVGVIVFLRKESLMGEALSHAAYPGTLIGVIVIGSFAGDFAEGSLVQPFILFGALLTALFGMKMVIYLKDRVKVSPDSALCFVLSFFFGIGVLLASQVQVVYSNLYRQVQSVFYGQAATMTDQNILIYGILVLFVTLPLILYRTDFKIWLFDETFAKLQGINVKFLEKIVFILTTLSVVIGIRTVGVVLMSAMLIAPAAAAFQWTKTLRLFFPLAAFFGFISASFGTYFSTEISFYLMKEVPYERIAFPTGPGIVIVSAIICLFSILFGKEKGVFGRLLRFWHFRKVTLDENLLKSLWRHPNISFNELKELLKVSAPTLYFSILKLKRNGLLEEKEGYILTESGEVLGRRIVRLHRLWELYLSDYVGIKPKQVHKSAEEMEHILTKEFDVEISHLLNDPKFDPHHQPIPKLK